MRSFSLINSLGIEWDLNTGSGSFFHDVKGFGFERDTDYKMAGTTFEATKDNSKQKKPSGKILFSGYKKYEDFAIFIQNKPLILTYTSSSQVKIKVSIEKLEKDELGDGGLDASIEFKNLGLFYKTISIENTTASGVGKVYPYTYPYTYVDNTMGEINIDSDSIIDSPVKLSIMGPCENPSWKHYVDGIEVAEGAVECTIPAGNKLVVDTSSIPYKITELTALNEFVRDHYQNSDFSKKRFILLKKGTNKIVFLHEGEDDLKVAAEGMILYDTL